MTNQVRRYRISNVSAIKVGSVTVVKRKETNYVRPIYVLMVAFVCKDWPRLFASVCLVGRETGVRIHPHFVTVTLAAPLVNVFYMVAGMYVNVPRGGPD